MKRMRASMKVAAIAGSIAVLAVAAVLLLVGNFLWTEYQWYQSMGQVSVLTTRLVSQGVLWLVAGAIAAGTIFSFAYVAGRQRSNPRGFMGATAAVALGLGAVISWNLASHWMTFRLAVAQSPFGIVDPLFHRDVGFFVFTLPALELANAWINGVLVITAIVVLGIAIFPEQGETRPVLTGRWWQLKPLLSVLLGLLVLSGAFGSWLAVWELAFAADSGFVGAGYTDIHALIPAQWTMVIFGLVIAAMLMIGARSRKWRLLAGLVAGWAVASFLLGTVWPGVMQNYVVNPNEAALEAPYLAQNISMTRTAFDMAATMGESYPAEERLSAAAALSSAATLSRARVWTPEAVSQAYAQLQTIRPYYKLSKIDTDRYLVDGELSQVLVAARQIDANALPAKARTWVNQHLVYTHGNGLTISSAHETTERGFPKFLVGDVPPRVASDVATSSPDLAIDEPRIYFGPDMIEYAITNTGIDEFDYPSGDGNVFYRNTTGSGVRLGGGLNRVSWAIRLGSDQLLFSDYLRADSRLLVNRDVRERARKLAPWLVLDAEPYAAIVDGRIVWILDGFTSSDHFPYSQKLSDGTNYLRDSVKITVDAASGETQFYATGDDPVRDAWMSIYPGVVRPEGTAPEALAAHFRVPKKLFSAQSKIYRTYHMTDVRVFYNKEDQWEFSGESSDQRVKPGYVLLKLPGTTKTGMYLVQPFAPEGSDNLVGWMAAACDPEDFGKQTVFLLPKDRVVLGPHQVTARINQDPLISPTLSLWNQRGSKVVFGDMLVLPVEESVAYIQPIFLQAQDTAITELAAVVVVSGDHVEMDSTLAGALAKTYGASSGADDSDLADRIEVLLAQSQAARAQGDLTAYSEKLGELQAAIEELGATAPVQ